MYDSVYSCYIIFENCRFRCDSSFELCHLNWNGYLDSFLHTCATLGSVALVDAMISQTRRSNPTTAFDGAV